MKTETPFASGCMPNTDFRYEEFEGFLASFYLTYLHLNESGDNKAAKFKELNDTLVRFATRHNVQSPEAAINNVRAKEDWAKPSKISSYWSVKDLFGAFNRDYGLSANVDDRPDIKALWELVNEPTFVF